MTVSVEIHQKHDDTFFLGSKRYLQVYLQLKNNKGRPTASSNSGSKLPTISPRQAG